MLQRGEFWIESPWLVSEIEKEKEIRKLLVVRSAVSHLVCQETTIISFAEKGPVTSVASKLALNDEKC